MKSGFEVKDGI